MNSRSLWCFIDYRSHAGSPHEESLRLRGDSSRVGCGAGHCNLDTCTSVSGRALSCRFAVLGARTGLCFALQRGGGVRGWGERGDDDDVVTQTARTLSPRERFTRYLYAGPSYIVTKHIPHVPLQLCLAVPVEA